MRVERTIIAIALILFMAVGIKSAIADPNAPTGIGSENSTRAPLSTVDQSLEAQAGNVTQLEINATSITNYWAGYFGNITSNIVLQDADGNNFYNWSNANPTGEVFATRNNSLEWSSIKCMQPSEVSNEETYLGHAATVADSITNTFSSTNHPEFSVASTTLTGCPSTNAFSNTGASASLWYNVLLSDAGNTSIYSTLLNATGTGFDGSLWDFELLVGENGTGGGALATTTYYFYVELS